MMKYSFVLPAYKARFFKEAIDTYCLKLILNLS